MSQPLLFRITFFPFHCSCLVSGPFQTTSTFLSTLSASELVVFPVLMSHTVTKLSLLKYNTEQIIPWVMSPANGCYCLQHKSQYCRQGHFSKHWVPCMQFSRRTLIFMPCPLMECPSLAQPVQTPAHFSQFNLTVTSLWNHPWLYYLKVGGHSLYTKWLIPSLPSPIIMP